jgi:hypothetical protein
MDGWICGWVKSKQLRETEAQLAALRTLLERCVLPCFDKKRKRVASPCNPPPTHQPTDTHPISSHAPPPPPSVHLSNLSTQKKRDTNMTHHRIDAELALFPELTQRAATAWRRVRGCEEYVDLVVVVMDRDG